MPFAMSKGKIEPITFSWIRFKLVNQFSFLWLSLLNCIASSNKTDLNIAFVWCNLRLMNCLPSVVGLAKSLVADPKSSSVIMQWLTSTNSTSPVGSAVQPCWNVSSKPLLANPEVSACRMRHLTFLMQLSKLCHSWIYVKALPQHTSNRLLDVMHSNVGQWDRVR